MNLPARREQIEKASRSLKFMSGPAAQEFITTLGLKADSFAAVPTAGFQFKDGSITIEYQGAVTVTEKDFFEALFLFNERLKS